MKVILLQDIARIGKRFEVKNVPDGHALNYLIPRGLAEPAKAENLKRLNERMAKGEAQATQMSNSFETLVASLGENGATMEVEANEQGHLFKGVKADDIAAGLEKEHGNVSRDWVVLHTPIKELGEHTIALRSGEREASFVLTLVKK